ncbi:MAG: hypothetical protein DRJ08_01325 [Acidobacteria bacterium]|nr:MAG: hypothetical protein DRJ08_01325 [Acidobacteriota bacterium]
MSKPFLKIGVIEEPKGGFDRLIEKLRESIDSLNGYQLGGVHRWSPQAFSFEFHNDETNRILLRRGWANVYMLPLFKVGVYLQGEVACLNLRRPAYYMDLLGDNLDGNTRFEVEKRFADFKGKVIGFFEKAGNELGGMALLHVEDGYDVDDSRMAYLNRLRKHRDIYRESAGPNPRKKVKELADKVVQGFDELEGWKIIDRREYTDSPGVESLEFIEFCTPKYAGISMEMNRKYNLLLPCLGSVRSENGVAAVNIYLPRFMFRPLFYSVDKKERVARKGFPEVVEGIIRDTCLKHIV